MLPGGGGAGEREGKVPALCVSVDNIVWLQIAFVLSAFYLAYIKYAACRNRARDYMKNPKDFICV